jgi:hypothetical protein
MKREFPLCAWCDEPILPGDRTSMGGVHYECGLRSIIGSVGHQKKCCSCYGGNEEDPPGLTRRQAATAAALYFHLNDEPNEN